MIHLAEFVVIHNMRHEAIVLSEASSSKEGVSCEPRAQPCDIIHMPRRAVSNAR